MNEKLSGLDKSQKGMVLQSAGNTERKYTTKAEEYILACEDEILDAPLREFLVKAEELGSTVISKNIIKSGLKNQDIDEVIMGQVLTSGSGQNPARQAAIKSGIPKETPAFIVNQV